MGTPPSRGRRAVACWGMGELCVAEGVGIGGVLALARCWGCLKPRGCARAAGSGGGTSRSCGATAAATGLHPSWACGCSHGGEGSDTGCRGRRARWGAACRRHGGRGAGRGFASDCRRQRRCAVRLPTAARRRGLRLDARSTSGPGPEQNRGTYFSHFRGGGLARNVGEIQCNFQSEV